MFQKRSTKDSKGRKKGSGEAKGVCVCHFKHIPTFQPDCSNCTHALSQQQTQGCVTWCNPLGLRWPHHCTDFPFGSSSDATICFHLLLIPALKQPGRSQGRAER